VLQERQKRKEDKERKTTEQQIENQQSVQESGGLWESEADITLNLKCIKLMKDKMSAIKHQIRARKTQPRPAPLQDQIFSFSKDGRTFNLQQLQNNLLNIILAHNTTPESAQGPSIINTTTEPVQGPSIVITTP
jgi:hypothetical protein